MTNDRVTPFLYEGETVRVIDKDGAPWFVAADVCRSLGLSNPSENVSGLDDDEKGISTTDTLGGNQGLFIISESGMFSLIFKSRKAEAARFRRWVTGEVLPSIRRTGAYVLPSVIVPWHPKPFEEWSLRFEHHGTIGKAS